MPLFTAKPAVSNLHQWTGDNFEEISAFCPSAVDNGDGTLTTQGVYRIGNGDYVDGEGNPYPQQFVSDYLQSVPSATVTYVVQ